MSRHTAPEELLLDYAAGALAQGPALAVALHVALDPVARRAVGHLDALGGALMEGEADAAVGRCGARAHARPAGQDRRRTAAGAAPRRGPASNGRRRRLRRLIGAEARWRNVLGGFEEIRLRLPGDSHRVSLLRLRPGRGLPMHRHVGTEYTVVLQGGYTDSTGNYGVGDFAVGPGPEQHEPIADPGPPCIALIVVEKPIVLTGPIGRWLNPLVRRDLI